MRKSFRLKSVEHLDLRIISAVYATEVSDEEYLAFTTEQTEKMEVYALAEKLDGDIEAAIRQLAEHRRREREA